MYPRGTVSVSEVLLAGDLLSGAPVSHCSCCAGCVRHLFCRYFGRASLCITRAAHLRCHSWRMSPYTLKLALRPAPVGPWAARSARHWKFRSTGPDLGGIFRNTAVLLDLWWFRRYCLVRALLHVARVQGTVHGIYRFRALFNGGPSHPSRLSTMMQSVA